MSIWNKVLVGFIAVLSLVFFYMAARTLKTHQEWRTSSQAFEKALEETLARQEEYREGIVDGEQKKRGIRQARLELHKVMLDRGRVWKNVMPSQASQQGPDGAFEVMVNLDSADHQISDKMILHLFEEELATKGGKYLGEFRVDGVAEKQVNLKPTMRMDQEEYQRVAGSQGPWWLYERVPPDRHRLFADLTEDEIRELIPESALVGYLKHGKPAEPGDPEKHVKDGEYMRPLVDFETALRQRYVRRTVLIDLLAEAQRDLNTIKTAHEKAVAQGQTHDKEIEDSKQELAKVTAARDAVATHLAEVEAQLAATEKAIQESIVQIKAMAAEIARIQLETTRKINERTRAVLQADASR